MRIMSFTMSMFLSLCLLSCSGEKNEDQAAKIAAECVQAMAKGDRQALQNLMTSQMYSEYVAGVEQLRASASVLASFGQKTPDISEIELVSTSCERIEGDTAYVDVETRLGKKAQFEKLILKKEDGKWKLAGKQ